MIRRITILILTAVFALNSNAFCPVEHGNHQTAAQPSKPPKPHTPPKPNKPTKPSYSGPTFTPTGSYGGHDYVDLGLPSGTLWATTNVGADKPEDYGSYFAWGETSPKSSYDWSNYKWCRGSYDTMTKYCTESKYGTVDNRTELELSDDAAYVNWGSGWRMPSSEQIKELIDKCKWTWTTRNGVSGYVVSRKGKSLFLPAAGYRYGSSLSYAGSYGYYWSRTLGTDYSYGACSLGFGSSGVDWSGGNRYGGRSVRAVRVSQN